MGKILVLYVFHEINERVEQFFNKCIFKDDNVDFIVISNGYKENLNLPSYVKIIRRNNLGFDFGGWSEAILRDELYKNYEYFIFLNSSVTGMFIPDYYKDRWTSIFINGLNEDNNVKLFGITINTERDPLFLSHVQSYLFCMNKSTLNFLIDRKIFTLNYNTTNKDECIQQKEILMSRHIIDNGWNIGALCNYYKGVDFTFREKKPHEYNKKFLSDLMFSKYRNVIWNEYQLVFLKGNRINLNE